MLVPSMTLEEIRKEINKDFPILLRKIGYVNHDVRKKLSKAQKAEGYSQFFDYTSKFKNQWIYRIHSFKKYSDNSAMLIYHNGKGHAGIAVSKDLSIIYHTGHFFLRYNERRNLNLKSINEIIRAYMCENVDIEYFDLYEISEGVTAIFGDLKSGIVLGTYNEPLDFLKLNTYIPHEMLSKNQNQKLIELKEATLKYDDTSELLN
jgi:hypothetical protein